jgi:GMP reductase
MKYKFVKPEIQNLTYEFDVPVYDLEVEEDHSFCVGEDNTVVHNCITYNKTGFASPMFSTVRDINQTRVEGNKGQDIKLPLIIADGGISCNGDIAKALVAGADMVMAGSMFARCIDSPAMIDPTDPTKKLYFGSASSMNGNKKNIEGRTLSMPMNGMTYEQKMTEIRQDLASAVSYAGGNNLKAFQEVEYCLL